LKGLQREELTSRAEGVEIDLDDDVRSSEEMNPAENVQGRRVTAEDGSSDDDAANDDVVSTRLDLQGASESVTSGVDVSGLPRPIGAGWTSSRNTRPPVTPTPEPKKPTPIHIHKPLN